MKTTKKGYTLLEIMIAMALTVTAMAMLTTFMHSSSRSIAWSVNKSSITSDFRLFTKQLLQDAANANAVYLYYDFDIDSCNEPSDRMPIGKTGNCLVFIRSEQPDSQSADRFYKSITVYYREPGTALSPVYRCNIDYPEPLDNLTTGEDGQKTLEDFLSLELDALASNKKEAFQLSTPVLREDFFRAINYNSYMINGQVMHGNQAYSTVNVYGFIISAKG